MIDINSILTVLVCVISGSLQRHMNKMQILGKSLIALLTLIAQTTCSWPCECPLECTCEDEFRKMQCSGYHMENFPAFSCTDRSVTELTISDSRIVQIERDVLRYMPNIKRLELNSTSIDYIHTCAFSGTTMVEEIVLNNVSVKTIVQNAFSDLKNIDTINISNSHVDTISSYAFHRLSNLTLISIQSSTIGTIEDMAFSTIRNITTFEVSDNTVLQVGNTILSNLFGLTSINILRNTFYTNLCNIERVFPAVFPSGHLSFSNNNLKCACGMSLAEPVTGPISMFIEKRDNKCINQGSLNNVSISLLSSTPYCSAGQTDNLCRNTTTLPQQHNNCRAFRSPLIPPEEVDNPTPKPRSNSWMLVPNIVFVLCPLTLTMYSII